MTDAPTTASVTTSEKEELDPELLDLPDPPKRERTATVVLLVVTALASLAMVFGLRRDAAYAFTPEAARNVGDLTSAPASRFADNAFVRGEGMLGVAHAIRYERPLVSGSFRLMPIAGRSDVWAEVRVPERGENARWVPPSHFTGRLVRFASAGPRHRGLADAVRDATGREVPANAWLLIDGATPGDARWAVLLVVLFASFAAWNVRTAAKLVRKVSG